MVPPVFVPVVPETCRVYCDAQKQITEEHRMDSTRVNADQLIEDLIRDTKLDEASEGPGLQLFIGKDGVPALSSAALETAASAD